MEHVDDEVTSAAMSKVQSFVNIGLQGHTVGSLNFKETRIEWGDKHQRTKEILRENITELVWVGYGHKGVVKVLQEDGATVKFDGFNKDDFEKIKKYSSEVYKIEMSPSSVASGGGHYGNVELKGKALVMTSIDQKSVFDIKLDNVEFCVVPTSNRDELEVQFREGDHVDKEEDCLAQITFHFPPGEENENEDEDNEEAELTLAEGFRKNILETGVITSVMDSIIVEFNREQGNFVYPRGKYSIQMTSTHMHMQGGQYSYKIKYTDINSLFLLPKMDGSRMAFVIGLEKPIRQGTSKFQYLVIETHKLEQTVSVNISEEELSTKYDGQLQKEMTAPLSTLIAKVFKVLTQSTVYIPKQFVSARDAHCIRCNLKAQEGLLYPLAKAFIFIHKPTLVIKYEDVESIEFLRYEDTMSSATKNFDIRITVKPSAANIDGGKEKEFSFLSIDRPEYSFLYDYFETKNLKLLNRKVVDGRKGKDLSGILGDDGGDDDEEEEDGDYEGGSQSDESDDSDDTDESGDEGGEKKQKKKKREKESKKKPKKDSKKAPKRQRDDSDDDDDDGSSDGGKATRKKKAKKDPNAPKKALTAYFFFTAEMRAKFKEQGTSMSITEFAKEMGRLWKDETSAADKERFEEMARKDKERYASDMASYSPADGDASSPSAKKQRAPSKPKVAGASKKSSVGGVKPPQSALDFFVGIKKAKVMKEGAGISLEDAMEKIRGLYAELGEDDRAAFEDMERQDLERFEEESAGGKRMDEE